MQINDSNLSALNAASSSPLQAGRGSLRGIQSVEQTTPPRLQENELADLDAIDEGRQVDDRDANEKFLLQRRSNSATEDLKSGASRSPNEVPKDDEVEMVDFQPPPSFEAWG